MWGFFSLSLKMEQRIGSFAIFYHLNVSAFHEHNISKEIEKQRKTRKC